MKFNRHILFCILLVGMLTICVASADENVTGKTQSDLNISEHTFNDIQLSVNHANDTVTLNGTYECSGDEITISKDITIEGNGATLNANHKSNIINIESGNVVLKNMNFINAKSVNNGGAIVSNGKLTIINCSFTNNIVSYGSANNLKYDPYFDYDYDNVGHGGAIYANDDLTIVNSSFKDNSAEFWEVLREMDMYYTENIGDGGAILSKGKLHITDSTFDGNSQNSIVAHDTADITNCIFKNQDATFSAYGNYKSTFNNCSFSNCGQLGTYSQINCEYFAETEIIISNCNFTNGNGGILRIYPSGKVYISNSRFINNTFISSQTATTLIEIDDYTKISNSTFINNTVRNTGILDLHSYDLENCTFENNNDGTIKTGEIILDNSLEEMYLFKAKLRKNLQKTYYKSGKTIVVDLINLKTGKIYWDWSVDVVVNGKAFYDYWFYDSVTFPVSTWKVGTYRVTVSYTNGYTYPDTVTFKIKVMKAPTSVKAPKVTAKYKKTKYFKITVKSYKKAIKGIVLKVKIGKKTYKLKTNSKGVAKFNTKKLKKGNYAVKITSPSKYYTVFKKSKIIIKK